MKNGGEGGIRTLARFYPPNPLAGGPLWPLGYLARLYKLWDKKAWVYHSWCKKLLIDVVFCSICFRNIWKGTFIPLRIPLAEFASYARTSPCILCRGCSFRYWWVRPESNQRHVDFQSTAATCWATDPYTRHKWNICWNWTNDRLFNRQLLYQLS